MGKNRQILLHAAIVAAALFSAAPSPAIEIYPVRRGSFKELFGEERAAIDGSFAKLTEKQARPFEGDAGLKGAAIFSGAGFQIIVFRDSGPRAVDPGEVGGTLAIQIHDGMTNADGAHAPVIFAYDMEPRPVLKTAMTHEASTGIEEDNARLPKSRVIPLVPAYRGFHSRRALPASTFQPLPNGWYAAFTFSWADFYGHIPFEEGILPASWRLVAEYTAPDGAVSRWGTLENPVALSWARGGDALVGSVRYELFMSDSLGPAYRSRAAYCANRWTTHQTEKHIGYADPGKPTFEQKNPDSDALFYACCAKPLLDSNAKMNDVLYFNWREGPQKPGVLSLAKSFRDEIYSKLDRIFFFTHKVESLRRDYLLARFTDRPVLPPPKAPEKEKPGVKAKPKKGADDLLDEPDTTGDGIDLDDITF